MIKSEKLKLCFLEKAKEAHGDRFDYSKVEYVNGGTKVVIICREHGEFTQRPNCHIKWNGCKKCYSAAHKSNINVFLKKAKEIHGNKYGYEKAEYLGHATKMVIICPKHGEFHQQPKDHIGRKFGCWKCGHEEVTALRRMNAHQFIQRAKEIHGDRYDYSKVDFYGTKNKVTIICREHGEFIQTPQGHFRGGCRKCVGNYDMTTSEFIQKANGIHDSKYDYSKTIYAGIKSKVTIICLIHGEFRQTPDEHLRGTGCNHCRESKGEKAIRLYFKQNKIPYEQQMKLHYSDGSYGWCDFMVIGNNPSIVEFNGMQHYLPVAFGSKKPDADILQLIGNIKRDLKRIDWAKTNRVPVLIIPYWDLERIPEILDDFLNGRRPTFSHPPEVVKKHKLMRNKIFARIAKFITMAA